MSPLLRLLSAPRLRLLLLGVDLEPVVLPPRSVDAGACAAPPVVDVLVVLAVALVVQHGAQPAHEVRVDELARALPPEDRGHSSSTLFYGSIY